MNVNTVCLVCICYNTDVKLISDPFCVVTDYRHGIRLATSVDDKVLITLNARSENDRTKFVEDLKEAIFEVRGPVFYTLTGFVSDGFA